MRSCEISAYEKHQEKITVYEFFHRPLISHIIKKTRVGLTELASLCSMFICQENPLPFENFKRHSFTDKWKTSQCEYFPKSFFLRKVTKNSNINAVSSHAAFMRR